ncbi:MAG TPA: SRPBCC family protein [Burkholderiales bacterium]|nr:SRPBCC family protein [Burkholderiales bacterium]
MSGSTFVYVSYIRATPEKLWEALTTPEIIKRYRFGMSVESEWKAGAPWRMYADGSLTDSGEILESVSPRRLVMSWLNEWKPEFKAEGHARCVFEIVPAGAAVKLTLTHSIERSDSRFIGAAAEGWPRVISNLKSLLETGDVALVYHRTAEQR